MATLRKLARGGGEDDARERERERSEREKYLCCLVLGSLTASNLQSLEFQEIKLKLDSRPDWSANFEFLKRIFFSHQASKNRVHVRNKTFYTGNRGQKP